MTHHCTYIGAPRRCPHCGDTSRAPLPVIDARTDADCALGGVDRTDLIAWLMATAPGDLER